MDTISGEAVGTETVRYGQRVSVDRPARAGDPDVAEGPRARRAARLRLRHRLQVHLSGERTMSLPRHRCRRHQHRRRAGRRQESCCMRSRRATTAGRRRAASSTALRRLLAESAVDPAPHRRGHDRHHAFHQRGRPAPASRQDRARCGSACRRPPRCRRSSTGRPICAALVDGRPFMIAGRS